MVTINGDIFYGGCYFIAIQLDDDKSHMAPSTISVIFFVIMYVFEKSLSLPLNESSYSIYKTNCLIMIQVTMIEHLTYTLFTLSLTRVDVFKFVRCHSMIFGHLKHGACMKHILFIHIGAY